jgi:hypothetical protein
MLATHRRAHRGIWLLLAPALPLFLLAVLATRPDRPKGPLPEVVRAARLPDDLAEPAVRHPPLALPARAWREVEPGADVERIALEGVSAPAIPETLVYLLPCAAPAEATPSGPDRALLLGRLGGRVRERWVIPAGAAPACAHLLLWSLFDERALGRLEVARAIEPAPAAGAR